MRGRVTVSDSVMQQTASPVLPPQAALALMGRDADKELPLYPQYALDVSTAFDQVVASEDAH